MNRIWKTIALAMLWLASAAHAEGPSVIEMPTARFATGDDPARARPEFDDSSWPVLSTLKNFEKQGFEGYDGYAWYRIHVRIPSSLRTTVRWDHRLRVYLSSIDDVDETFLNGTKIGAMGQMPEDPRGYSTRWNGIRTYYVDLASNLVRWDADNVIAIRLYDGSGGGGFSFCCMNIVTPMISGQMPMSAKSGGVQGIRPNRLKIVVGSGAERSLIQP